MGFVIQTILMDMELGKLKGLLPYTVINFSLAKENFSEIEYKTWVIKENQWGGIIAMPFKKADSFCHIIAKCIPVKAEVSNDRVPFDAYFEVMQW